MFVNIFVNFQINVQKKTMHIRFFAAERDDDDKELLKPVHYDVSYYIEQND